MSNPLPRLKLRKLQYEIQKLCGFTFSNSTEDLLFNLPYDIINKNNFYDEYINFLNFSLESIKDFISKDTPDVYAAYSIPELNDDELRKFNKIVETYSKKYNVKSPIGKYNTESKEKEIQNEFDLSTKKYPTDKQLYAFNEMILDKVIDPIRFNSKSEEYIWNILKNRTTQLNECMDRIRGG